MKTFIAEGCSSLKEFTDSVYPQGAFCLAALLRAGDIKINGVRAGKNARVNAGDRVVYYTTPAQEGKPSHNVIYRDENILIADKYSGVTSEGLLSELCGGGEFYAVHRLDRNTQGLIIFARTKAAENELLTAFKERKISKTYMAVCKNRFKQKSARLTSYMLKSESGVRVYSTPVAGALTAVTEYTVLEEWGELALAEITLHTGRTHQIRAQMAKIGCPVLGDEKYGDNALNAKYAAKRQRLVAKRISFNLSGGLSYLNGREFESSFALERPQ